MDLEQQCRESLQERPASGKSFLGHSLGVRVDDLGPIASHCALALNWICHMSGVDMLRTWSVILAQRSRNSSGTRSRAADERRTVLKE
jgi:hypothetical protein